jgi:WD40 repeat protein
LMNDSYNVILYWAYLENNLLASSGEDGWIRIWDMETGIELKSFYDKYSTYLLTVASNDYLIGAEQYGKDNESQIYVWNYEKFNLNKKTQIITDFGKYKIFHFI